MISIVIPALNEERFIGNCLRSLVNQNYSNGYEIIVMDNGSEDKTVEIAENYCDRLFVESESSLSEIRNKGIKRARGEVIAQIDADCIASESWLKEVEEGLREADLVSGPIEPIENSHFFDFSFWLFSDLFLTYAINCFGFSNVLGGNCAFWKEKAEQIGGFKETFPADGKFAFEMSKVGKLYHNPEMRAKTSVRRYRDLSLPKLFWEACISHLKMRVGNDKTNEKSYYWNRGE